jgi:2,3-bisphosphoglycerate-dependent phosphoglycerate mutase
MGKLILLRHGASVWNDLNLFTGWVDIPLSSKGIGESLKAGKALAGVPIDVIFTSSLMRAQQTAMLAMSVHQGDKVPRMLHPKGGRLEAWGTVYSTEAEERCIPVVAAWQLNERMYGELQGMNKQEARERFGEEQVHRWRRSYKECPPGGESLEMTAVRTLPYFRETVLPYLRQGKNVLIAAHGNSLRSIVMDLENLSEEAVVKLEIPTGVPLIYTYDKETCVRDGI